MRLRPSTVRRLPERRSCWWVLRLPLAFGIFVVVVGGDKQYGVVGTARRIGMWMLILSIAAAGVITLRRGLPAIIRSRA